MAVGATQTGFPKDFPTIIDSGGLGKGQALGGFGGDAGLDRNGHQAAVRRNPVILVHGNGGNATHATWGMTTLRDQLKGAGYSDCEIWALDYLGRGNTAASLPNPISENVNDLRQFIDQVRAYLGANKVDIIGHSLGASLGRAYLTGLQSDGTWDPAQRRFDVVGTLIVLGAANYGLGKNGPGEFRTGSPIEEGLHKVGDVIDDTPYGSTTPPPPYDQVTALDDNSITYGAFIAIGDFVEKQFEGTGRLNGAHVNKSFLFEGDPLKRHELLLKDAGVFQAILPLLNRRR